MSASLQKKVRQANRWREAYNPLRSLTLARAVSLLETYQRGDMADLQWTYSFVEQTDADLFALVERRIGAILELDWNIKVVSEEKSSAFDEALAEDQQAALREAYERVDNLSELFEHLASASFRGFAHAEKWRDSDNTIKHFEILDQWNVVRDGLYGEWKYNPEARQTSFASIPGTNLIDPADWVIRTVRRHIDRVGLVKFIRSNLSQKDWDAFIEIYGLPGVIITGPAQVPEGKQTDYQDAAEAVAEGGSGYLPNGSTVTTLDGPRGTNPFRDHLQYLSEKLILAGTGGLLTMLTAPTGIGKGPSEEHADVFATIAKAEARKISEALQRGFDLEVLDQLFTGKPVLAYFELAANEETDVSQIVDDAVKLSQAGLQMDVEELSEKTGYSVSIKAAQAPEMPNTNPQEKEDESDDQEPDNGVLLNRDQAEGTEPGLQEVITALSTDMRPVLHRLLNILSIEDAEIRTAKLKAFKSDFPKLAEDVLADPAAAIAMEKRMGSAMASGMKGGMA